MKAVDLFIMYFSLISVFPPFMSKYLQQITQLFCFIFLRENINVNSYKMSDGKEYKLKLYFE
jgi:hypothetical protein